MRKAYNNVSIVRNEEKENELIGVSLGYDYCAEHEWESKKSRKTLEYLPKIKLVSLALIYFGAFLDKVFKTENKTFFTKIRKKS
jgi:hypothetical protein